MVSINYGYGITRKFLEEAGHDELLLKHLDRLSPAEQDELSKYFAEAMCEEIVSFLAIKNRSVFADYLKDRQVDRLLAVNLN